MPCTRTHRVFGLGPDTLQIGLQRALAGGEGAVDFHQRRIELLCQLFPLGITDKRTFQNDDLGLAAVFIQHVLQVAEPGFEAHHPVFPQ